MVEENKDFNSNFVQSVFNANYSIMILTDGWKISRVNKAFLEFVGYDSFEDFFAKHKCISELFLEEDDLLTPMIGDLPWANYVLQSPNNIHKIGIIIDSKKYYFSLNATKIKNDTDNRSLVTFKDITEYEVIKQRFEYSIKGSNEGVWDWDLITNEVYFSPRWKSMLGYKDYELKNVLKTWDERVHPDDKEQAYKDIKNNQEKITEFFENFHRLKHKNGHWVWIHDKGKTYFNADGEPIRMVGTHTDITELKESERLKEVNIKRAEVLLQLPILSEDLSEYEFMQEAQELTENLTNSKISFIHFVNEDQETIELVTWSNRTLEKYCEAVSEKHYPISEAGIWANAFRQREAILVNDYEAYSKKNGLPEGHAKLDRFISVPVIEDAKVVMLTGVGNKEGEYSDIDVETVQLISNDIWRLIQNNRRKDNLDKSKEQLSRAQRLALIGSFEWNLKNNEVTCSDELYNILHLDPTDIELDYDLYYSFILEDDRHVLQEQREKFKEKKTAYTIQYRIKLANDDIIHIKEITEPEIDENGEIKTIFSTFQDITQAYKRNAEIRLLKKAIDKSPLSIAITDTDGNIVYVNPHFCKLTGYTYEEAMGNNPRILKSEYNNNVDYNDLWSEISSGQVWSGVFKNKKKNGDDYWESAIIVPIDNEKGEIVNYLGIKQEITEEVKLRQELSDKDEIMIAQSRHAAMGEMISMIAHQWRQPISIIAMGANNILADIELEMVDNEQLKKDSNDIIEQTRHLSKTIDDFRNFFKPNKDVDRVNIRQVYSDAYGVIGKSLENNDIEIEEDFKEDCEIETYSRELMQVLINLIKNSKEAMIEKKIDNKKIKISVRRLDNELLISICDKGGGISENAKNRIFEPYFSTKDEKTGTGLGLYMSKTIVEKHLIGTIGFENMDDGVCFEIKLPLKFNKA